MVRIYLHFYAIFLFIMTQTTDAPLPLSNDLLIIIFQKVDWERLTCAVLVEAFVCVKILLKRM